MFNVGIYKTNILAKAIVLPLSSRVGAEKSIRLAVTLYQVSRGTVQNASTPGYSLQSHHELVAIPECKSPLNKLKEQPLLLRLL